MKFYFEDLNSALTFYARISTYRITITSRVHFNCNNYSYYHVNISFNFSY